MSGGSDPGAWTGVRVLDLADEGAILGTKILAQLGCDVLRIEPPEGDPIRRLGPFADDRVDPEWRLSHWWYNAGKRSAILDTGTAAGRARLVELAGDFETRDGWVMMAAITQGRWTTLVDWAFEVGGREEWLRDPALVPSATRNTHRDKINAWIAGRWRGALLRRCGGRPASWARLRGC